VVGCADEKQLLEFRQQEVDALQHRVTSLRAELKAEMTQAKQFNESHVRLHSSFQFFLTCVMDVIQTSGAGTALYHQDLSVFAFLPRHCRIAHVLLSPFTIHHNCLGHSWSSQ